MLVNLHFLSFRNTEMSKIVKIPPTPISDIFNNMVSEDLTIVGAGALVAVILT